uniref:Endonuclease/exonuclease/phosphatase domain-containing protein n=1 Tax=Amphimedon queenslandica TaxID=400682 RepID=A0A1X7UPZ9_AMPQE
MTGYMLVVMYLSQSHLLEISSSLLFTATNVELIMVQLNSSPPILLCRVYLPPKSPESSIHSLLSHLSSFSHLGPFILVGDFNFADIDWSSFYATCPSSRLFCNYLFTNNLVQLVDSPTHSHGNILDLIVTSHPELVTNITVGDASCCNVSDHQLVLFSVVSCISSSRNKPSYFYKYNDTDMDSISSYLSSLSVTPALQSEVESACFP